MTPACGAPRIMKGLNVSYVARLLQVHVAALRRIGIDEIEMREISGDISASPCSADAVAVCIAGAGCAAGADSAKTGCESAKLAAALSAAENTHAS